MVQHVNCVLLATWLVFVTREVLPLAFFDGVPTDRADTWVFFTVSALLSFAAVLAPLLAPRPYIPYDPKVCVHVIGPDIIMAESIYFTEPDVRGQRRRQSVPFVSVVIQLRRSSRYRGVAHDSSALGTISRTE